jgi:hypothetical protein
MGAVDNSKQSNPDSVDARGVGFFLADLLFKRLRAYFWFSVCTVRRKTWGHLGLLEHCHGPNRNSSSLRHEISAAPSAFRYENESAARQPSVNKARYIADLSS